MNEFGPCLAFEDSMNIWLLQKDLVRMIFVYIFKVCFHGMNGVVKIIFLSAAIVLLGGCGALYGTKYSNDKISLGDSRKSVVHKFGRPYSSDLMSEDGKELEVLCYKEQMPYGYMLNTYFYFSDGRLVKKIQVDEKPSTVVVEDRCDHK